MNFPSKNSLYGALMSKGVVKKKTDPGYQSAKSGLKSALSSVADPDKQEKVKKQGAVFLQSTASKQNLLVDLMQLTEMASKDPYQILDTFKGKYPNNVLIDYIYEASADATGIRQVLGLPPDRDTFVRDYDQAREYVAEKLGDNGDLQMTLPFKSFPWTYFHLGGAKALVANNRLTNPTIVPGRVARTGELILASANKDHGLIMTLAIGMMHAYRRSMYRKAGDYSEDSVEMTLLAFSCFGAEALKLHTKGGLKEAKWFLFWKVFGSLFGLPPDRLHVNYQAARLRMDYFDNHMERIRRDTTSPQLQNDPRRRLLEAFLVAEFNGAPAETILSNVPELYSPHLRYYLTGR